MSATGNCYDSSLVFFPDQEGLDPPHQLPDTLVIRKL